MIDLILPRRQFLAGLAAALAAPAIVRVDSLMKLPRPRFVRIGEMVVDLKIKVRPSEMTVQEAHKWLHDALHKSFLDVMQTQGPIPYSDRGWDILQEAAESVMGVLLPKYDVSVVVR